MKPTISVIVPAYNAENYIKDTLNSILGQSFSDFKLFVLMMVQGTIHQRSYVKNISKQECYEYISSFWAKEHKECMELYCIENRSLKNLLKWFAIKTNNVKLLYVLLKS